MRRRVLTAIMTVTTIVVLLFAIPLAFVLVRLANERAVLTLEHRVDLAARTIDLTSNADEPDLTEFPSGDEHFALYTPKGTIRIGDGPTRLDALLVRTGSRTPVTQRVGGQLVTVVPILTGETTLGFMRASRPSDTFSASIWRTLALLCVGVLSVLVVGWLLAARIAARISVSTTALRSAAMAIGNGNFTTRLAPVGIPELDDVAHALGQTAADLDRLITNQQSFAADVSHQLRTPLAGMRAAIETESAFPRPDRQTILDETLSDLSRLEQTVTDILTLARTKHVVRERINLTDVVSTAREYWAGAFARQGRVLSVSAHKNSTASQAFGHPELLRQAIDALLDNALSHGGGTTTIEVEHEDNMGTATICVSIIDSGTGFPATVDRVSQEHPGELSDGVQHGLGLVLTHRLVVAQGGRLILPVPGTVPTAVRILLQAPDPTP